MSDHFEASREKQGGARKLLTVGKGEQRKGKRLASQGGGQDLHKASQSDAREKNPK